MADFTDSGISDLIKALEGADLFTDEVQEELINVGADNLISTIREEAGRSQYNVGPLLQKLSKSRKVKKDRSGAKYKVVTVGGKHPNGQRLATILFVLNYGRSERYGEIPGSYFWTRAVQRAEKTSTQAMEKAVTKHLEEKGLI